MIPKTIHYCWFGGNSKPKLVEKCIASWHKYCPDYEINEWNESNFDINLFVYAKEAYESKKWAFVSDVARLFILYNHGGIYLDTDMELTKPIDKFLNSEGFLGFESSKSVATGIIGVQKQNEIIRKWLSEYEDRKLVKNDGTYDETTNVFYLTKKLEEHGLSLNGKTQIIAGFNIYPKDYFSPLDFSSRKIVITNNTHAIHHYSASWKSLTWRLTAKLRWHGRRVIGDRGWEKIVKMAKRVGLK